MKTHAQHVFSIPHACHHTLDRSRYMTTPYTHTQGSLQPKIGPLYVSSFEITTGGGGRAAHTTKPAITHYSIKWQLIKW